MDARIAMVRPPGPHLSEGLVTFQPRLAVDVPRAFRQWRSYAETLAAASWRIVEVPAADDCPDAVFVEDAVVIFDSLAVLTRPGAESRRPEVPGVEKIVDSLGLSTNRIVAPGTLDGGDVLKVGRTVYVGRGGRTNAEGIRQLRQIIAPLGFTVVAVPTTKVLHLKSAVTALPDGTVIGFPPNVDSPQVFERFLAVPEETGAHVVVLDDEHVLMASTCPASASLVGQLGYEPVVVDIDEFEKLEGCVTCLSVRIRHAAVTL